MKKEKIKVVVTDYTDYKEDMNLDGGGYSYTTVYKNIDDEWRVQKFSSYLDEWKVELCKCSCEKEFIFDLEEELPSVVLDKYKEVEIFISVAGEEKDVTEKFIEA